MAKFPSEDHAAVSASAAAVLASATEAKDGKAPLWHPDNKCTSEVLFDVISSRSALSGPDNDGQRFARTCSPSSIPTSEGRSSAGA